MDSDKASQRRDSQDTEMSLLQMDPSPIETPSADREKDSFRLPDESMESSNSSLSSGTTTTAPGVSRSTGASTNGNGHSRSSIYYLTRLQKYSSYAFGIFTGLHLANVSLIPAVTRSVPASETYLLMSREIYQTALTEPLLIGLPVLAHVGSGIALRLIRRWQNAERYGVYAHDGSHKEDGMGSSWRPWAKTSPWPRLSYISIAGYAFAVFFSAHVCVNRVLPLAVEGDSANVGLAYVAHGFARHPLPAILAYGGLILAGTGHMVWGAARWLGFAPASGGLLFRPEDFKFAGDRQAFARRRKRWLQVSGAALGVSLLWAVGGMGVVARGGAAEGWVGKLYDALFARVGLGS